MEHWESQVIALLKAPTGAPKPEGAEVEGTKSPTGPRAFQGLSIEKPGQTDRLDRQRRFERTPWRMSGFLFLVCRLFLEVFVA